MWRVEERRGREGLESLSVEWHDLETRCRCATPFQSPEWQIPWWTFFAHGELRLSSRIVAVHFGFQWRGRHCYYIGGFDPDFASLSVGSVVLHHAIRSAADEGASEIDFLRGAESYKYRWGATDRPNYRRILRRAVSA